MNTVVLIDSFKGSLSSYEAGTIIKETIKQLNPEDTVTVLPVADGGEGTVSAFQAFPNNKSVSLTVKNPLLEPTTATYVILPNEKAAATKANVPELIEEAKVDAAAAAKVEASTEANVEAKVEAVVEPKVELAAEACIEAVVEPTTEPTAEPKVELAVEACIEAVVEPTTEPTAEPIAEARVSANTTPTDALAIMEMSQASGITLLKDHLAPLEASTYGVGEMILDALDKNIRHFVIGIGGSATNDGGVGMLKALGYRFLTKKGNDIQPGNAGLSELSTIDLRQADARLQECSFDIACDVDNPLTGKRGAAAVFAPQKGASAEQVKEIEANLLHLHTVTKQVLPEADNLYPGVGAAGGLGYAFKNYLHANLKSGIELILKKIKAEDYIKEADLVITGEGKIDFQTAMGKAPIGVAKLAKKYAKPVIAFAGVVDFTEAKDKAALFNVPLAKSEKLAANTTQADNTAVAATNKALTVNQAGIDAFFPILDQLCTLDEALSYERAKANLARTVTQVINLIKLWKAVGTN